MCEDRWNGASNIAELNADAQILTGTVLVGSNSSLTLTLSNGSAYEGAISNSKDSEISTEVGSVTVILDETGTWTLTADTAYISEFNGSLANVNTNGYTLYVNGTAM